MRQGGGKSQRIVELRRGYADALAGAPDVFADMRGGPGLIVGEELQIDPPRIDAHECTKAIEQPTYPWRIGTMGVRKELRGWHDDWRMQQAVGAEDRKSTRLNSSHANSSY